MTIARLPQSAQHIREGSGVSHIATQKQLQDSPEAFEECGTAPPDTPECALVLTSEVGMRGLEHTLLNLSETGPGNDWQSHTEDPDWRSRMRRRNNNGKLHVEHWR